MDETCVAVVPRESALEDVTGLTHEPELEKVTSTPDESEFGGFSGRGRGQPDKARSRQVVGSGRRRNVRNAGGTVSSPELLAAGGVSARDYWRESPASVRNGSPLGVEEVASIFLVVA